MAVGDIGGIGPGQVPADIRALAAEVALRNAKPLSATLTPGEILTARVGAALGEGNVALTVRGQTVVANSATPLLPDTLVKLLVQSIGDQPVLRIIDTGAPDNDVLTSTPSSRALALGLPSTAVAALALQAFEQASAPLDPVRLKEAVAQLQALPPSQVPQRAQALALLAQTGLPTTPPFIALAERSAAGNLPNPAAALADLQRLVQSTTTQAPTSASPLAGSAPATSASTPLPATNAPDPNSRPAAASPSSAASSQSPVVSTPGSPVAAPTVTPPTTVVGGQPTTLGSTLPAQGAQVVNALVQQAVTNATTAGFAASTTAEAPPAVPTTSPAATTTPAASGAPLPAALAGAAPTVGPPAVPLSPSAPAAATTLPVPLAPGTPVPATGAPATSLMVSQVPTITTLAGTLVPDLARGGATAVLQAMALAGVRPRETGEVTVPKSEPTLLHRLDVPVEESTPIRATIDSTMRPPHQPQMEAAIAHIMREQAAETVVKPQALVDYDLVVGLPLQVNGQPMPARLAVAERKTSAGTATFLRVDAELTHLGPLSVRISGIEGGPMAITVLGIGPALGALADALPDLNESLRALGLTAGVRVADLREDLDHG